VITGAIGDHGTSRSTNQAGKPSQGGSYVLLNLTRGTILLNKTALDKNIDKAFKASKLDSSTCSLQAAATGPLTIVGGTGLYTGISGTVRITLSIGFVLPRYTSGAKAGQCNSSNASTPAGSLQLVHGSGTVSFS
jgi:hypothetical protein